MTDTKCIDSSVWLAYYMASSPAAKEVIDNEGLLITPIVCLYEIKKKLLSLKKDPQKLFTFIIERSSLIVVDRAIVEKAAEFAIEKKLGAMDALIYTTAILQNAELITGDNDFRGLPMVIIIS